MAFSRPSVPQLHVPAFGRVPLGVPAIRRRNDQYLRPDGRVRSDSGVGDRSDCVAGGGGGVVVRVSLVGGFWTRTRTVARGEHHITAILRLVLDWLVGRQYLIA
jgi:hypothetical protein